MGSSWAAGGSSRGLVVSVVDCSPTGRRFGSASGQSTLTVVRDWVIKDLGISNHVCATGDINDPVPF